MKPMVGVGVFAKQDMISWILEGIATSFPPSTPVRFFFEACTDKSLPNFQALAPKILPGYSVSFDASSTHILEHGVHCQLIDTFMASDCDVLVVPQDDNKFCGDQLLLSIERVIATLGTSLGWIGGRDGYEVGYANMISSPFSTSDLTKTKIKIGEFAERSRLNTGPVVYTRPLVEKIGQPDLAFEGWYWWDDYSLRARQAGLKNVLLGMDCLHEKFGELQSNPTLNDPAMAARDLKRLTDRWGK